MFSRKFSIFVWLSELSAQGLPGKKQKAIARGAFSENRRLKEKPNGSERRSGKLSLFFFLNLVHPQLKASSLPPSMSPNETAFPEIGFFSTNQTVYRPHLICAVPRQIQVCEYSETFGSLAPLLVFLVHFTLKFQTAQCLEKPPILLLESTMRTTHRVVSIYHNKQRVWGKRPR